MCIGNALGRGEARGLSGLRNITILPPASLKVNSSGPKMRLKTFQETITVTLRSQGEGIQRQFKFPLTASNSYTELHS